MSRSQDEADGPPRSVSRRQFLQASSVACVSALAARPVDARATEDGGQTDPPSQSERLFWRFQTGDWVTAAPTVVDETVYIGSQDAHLYALDAETGSQEWRYQATTPIEQAPAVLPAAQSPFEGAGVFFGDQSEFYAVAGETAEPQWTADIVEATSPILTGESVVFYGDRLKRYQVDGGSKEWESSLVSGFEVDETGVNVSVGSPVLVDDEIYVGTLRGEVLGVSAADGTSQWSFDPGASVQSSPTVHEGKVIVGDSEGTLYAVEQGSDNWEFSPSDGSITAAATVSEDTVFVGSTDGNVYAVDAESGEERWRFETEQGVRSAPTVADDTVFVGSTDGRVYAIDAGTGDGVWQFDTGDIVRSSPTVVDGVLFVGGWNGNVYALDAGVSGSSEDTRVDQGVLGHHHSHVDGDEQSLDPTTRDTVQTPPGGTGTAGGGGGFSSDGTDGPGFGVGAALAGLGAGLFWAHRRTTTE